MEVRAAVAADAAAWVRLREALWPYGAEEHAREVAEFLAGSRRLFHEALVAVDVDGHAIGFVEISIRPLVNGCTTDRVAFLEGWYVAEEHRGSGVGAALVRAAEQWAREQGCVEFASDVEIDNAGSIAAHVALGFTETDRVVCFRKDL